ncbi:MAG: hypothetical protein IPM32_10545 [Ignavibacteriae bacterium]|nr:hypothetical protein [Ignavibacteriota bacterium]
MELKMYTIYDFIGNVGVFLIITAFLLLQLNKIKSENIYYSLMNLFGATFVIISLINNFNFSAFIIEAFWIIISLIGIVNFYRNRNK